MTTETEINFERLKEPFPATQLEFRIGQCGKSQGGRLWATAFTYVTNRAIMDRLDEVCGPTRWRNEFEDYRGAGALCGISILANGQWITKWDGADDSQTEPFKGGLSDSMKRAAVQWGIGRYLYRLDSPFLPDNHISTERQSGPGWRSGFVAKDKQKFWWRPPKLPAWALPDQSAETLKVMKDCLTQAVQDQDGAKLVKYAHLIHQRVDEGKITGAAAKSLLSESLKTSSDWLPTGARDRITSLMGA